MEEQTSETSGTIAGSILIATAALSIAVIINHPTLGSPGYESIAHEAVAESIFNRLIHGVMIAFSLGFYFSLSVMSDRLGLEKASVKAAQLSIAVATITMIGAALVAGFVVPGVAERLVGAEQQDLMLPMARLLGTMNQVLANFGTIAYGAALFFWSIRLSRQQGAVRGAGLFGLVAGAAMAIAIVTGMLVLDVHGMTIVLVIMGLWLAWVGYLLLRGKI